jgi:transposase
MHKRLITPTPETVRSHGEGWLDVERAAIVEVTSEDKDYPVESAFVSGQARGWRAAIPGSQTIRLVFDQPQRLKHISLVFEENETTRTQDSQEALELVDSVPPLQGERGCPRCRPDCVVGDRGYDAESIRRGLRDRGIVPLLAMRNTEHGSGLGQLRWVVERTFAWLNQFRRLRIRYEKRADIHEAFLALGCILICWRFLYG